MIGICVNLISFSQAYSISAFSISVNDGAGHSVFHVADVCGQTVWCWVLWLGLGNEKWIGCSVCLKSTRPRVHSGTNSHIAWVSLFQNLWGQKCFRFQTFFRFGNICTVVHLGERHLYVWPKSDFAQYFQCAWVFVTKSDPFCPPFYTECNGWITLQRELIHKVAKCGGRDPNLKSPSQGQTLGYYGIWKQACLWHGERWLEAGHRWSMCT